MVSINIRELTHNFSKYLKDVKKGERIIIMERNKAVAEIIPHNENVAPPGWKREIKRLKVAGEMFSDTVINERKKQV